MFGRLGTGELILILVIYSLLLYYSFYLLHYIKKWNECPYMQAVVKIHEYLHDGIKILTEWRELLWRRTKDLLLNSENSLQEEM